MKKHSIIGVKEKRVIRWLMPECDNSTGRATCTIGVRMLVASFLCKNLLIDWRWGEAYFAQKLNDFDLSANNGNWQWAAGCGSDATPYFRVFNPTAQAEKFDKDLVYIRKWIPEFDTNEYPKPIVEYTFSRERALDVYANAVKANALR